MPVQIFVDISLFFFLFRMASLCDTTLHICGDDVIRIAWL